MSKQAGIVGCGMYVPEKVLTNKDLEKIVDTSDEWIYTRSGIKERHIAAPDEAASDLGIYAAKNALKDAGIKAADIDLVIVATSTGDHLCYPSTAAIIQNKLGCHRAGAFDLSVACTGFIYALEVARGFINNGVIKNILVVGTEVNSRFVNWQDRSTCVLFGDGAGAVIITEVKDETGIINSFLRVDGSREHVLKVEKGGSRRPIDKLNDPQNYIFMDGKEVFKFAVGAVISSVQKILDDNKLKPEDIAYIVPHQANIRIIDAAAKRFHIPVERVYANIHKYGNTSAATIPICFTEMRQEKKLKKGDLIITVGFGAGLAWGANLIKWSY